MMVSKQLENRYPTCSCNIKEALWSINVQEKGVVKPSYLLLYQDLLFFFTVTNGKVMLSLLGGAC